jgi:hypothetical protein
MPRPTTQILNSKSGIVAPASCHPDPELKAKGKDLIFAHILDHEILRRFTPQNDRGGEVQNGSSLPVILTLSMKAKGKDLRSDVRSFGRFSPSG